MVALLSVLLGAVLGTRFKVFCLVPTAVIGIAAAVVINVLIRAPIISTLQAALAIAVGLQLGYLFGLTVRSVIVAARARRIAEWKRFRGEPARIL
jgi:hypothetical protein